MLLLSVCVIYLVLASLLPHFATCQGAGVAPRVVGATIVSLQTASPTPTWHGAAMGVKYTRSALNLILALSVIT